GKFVYVTGKDKDGKDIAVVKPIVLGDWIEIDGQNLWIVESGLKAGDNVIVDGMARVQPNGPIMLGPPPGAPGAAPPGAPEAKSKETTTAKDGDKSAPPPKS